MHVGLAWVQVKVRSKFSPSIRTHYDYCRIWKFRYVSGMQTFEILIFGFRLKKDRKVINDPLEINKTFELDFYLVQTVASCIIYLISILFLGCVVSDLKMLDLKDRNDFAVHLSNQMLSKYLQLNKSLH